MGATPPEVLEIPDPDFVQADDEAYVVAFVGDSGQFVAEAQGKIPEKTGVDDDFRQVSDALREDTLKFSDMSRQSMEELSDGALNIGLSELEIVNPPYPPKCLANFLEVDPVFFRAVKAKVLDSVGRAYLIQPKWPIKTKNATPPEGQTTISAGQFRKDQEAIVNFIESCNETIGFRGVLERAAMDYEAIGWAGLEVIRNMAGLVVSIEHIPAQRLRVLKGFKGFVEQTSDMSGPAGIGRYYQKFGRKFLVKDGAELVPYDPAKHGDINKVDLVPNFVDYETGKPTDDFNKSANEVLYIPKHHSNTIYYGYSDVIPALGAVVANVYIRDYILQFFEHNTVPRYAVIIKGAKIDDNFRNLIAEYFTTNVKGHPHKTLILTLQGQSQKEITIDFQKLETDHKEADFLQTQKQNSERIMTAMGTSPAILGIAEHSELGSGKGLSQAEIYKDRIVDPCQRHWAEKLNLLFRRGLGVKNAILNFDPLDIRDMLLEMQYLTGMQSGGNLSINELRKAAGLGEPIEGGDTHILRVKEGAVVQVKDLPEIPPLPDPSKNPAPVADTENPGESDNDDTENKGASDEPV